MRNDLGGNWKIRRDGSIDKFVFEVHNSFLFYRLENVLGGRKGPRVIDDPE